MSSSCPKCKYQRNPNNAQVCELCGFDLSKAISQPQSSFPEQNLNPKTSPYESRVSHTESAPTLKIEPQPETKLSYPELPPTLKIEAQPEAKLSYPEPPTSFNIQPQPEAKLSYPEPPTSFNIQPQPEAKLSYPEPPTNIRKSSMMNITCPQCKHQENPPDTQFCDVCGYEFTSTPNEQLPLAESSNFSQDSTPLDSSNFVIDVPQPTFPASTPVPSGITARLIAKQVDSPVAEFVLEDSNIVGRFDRDSGPVEVDLEGFPGDHYISRNHAEIYREAGEWKIKDLGSENGVFIKRVNQSRFGPAITTPQIISSGDELAFAKIRFIFQSP